MLRPLLYYHYLRRLHSPFKCRSICLPGLNFTLLRAGIGEGVPVLGFLPLRAVCFHKVKVPNPWKVIVSSSWIDSVKISSNAFIKSIASFCVIRMCSAILLEKSDLFIALKIYFICNCFYFIEYGYIAVCYGYAQVGAIGTFQVYCQLIMMIPTNIIVVSQVRT